MNTGEEHTNGLQIPEDLAARYDTYRAQAQRVLDEHTRSFDVLTASNQRLRNIGDGKLQSAQASGYNIFLMPGIEPLETSEHLIYYHNYIGRVEHFSLLLALMDRAGLITPEQVRWGVRASKVINTGEWEEDSADVAHEAMTITRPDGTTTDEQVERTVETALTFVPHGDTNAHDIAEFLLERTRAGAEGAIPGSWIVPDIRTTANLADVLRPLGRFTLVQANTYVSPDAPSRLVVLRETKRFGQRWRAAPVEINEKLASYLVSAELGIGP